MEAISEKDHTLVWIEACKWMGIKELCRMEQVSKTCRLAAASSIVWRRVKRITLDPKRDPSISTNINFGWRRVQRDPWDPVRFPNTWLMHTEDWAHWKKFSPMLVPLLRHIFRRGGQVEALELDFAYCDDDYKWLNSLIDCLNKLEPELTSLDLMIDHRKTQEWSEADFSHAIYRLVHRASIRTLVLTSHRSVWTHDAIPHLLSPDKIPALRHLLLDFSHRIPYLTFVSPLLPQLNCLALHIGSVDKEDKRKLRAFVESAEGMELGEGTTEDPWVQEPCKNFRLHLFRPGFQRKDLGRFHSRDFLADDFYTFH